MEATRIPNKAALPIRVALAAAASFALVATSMVMAPAAEAASGGFSIKSLKWVKKSIDVTTTFAEATQQARLKVSVNNSVAGSNSTSVTIQNTKSKVKMTEDAFKGTAVFAFKNTKKHAGKWKVISVAAVRKTTKTIGRTQGSWGASGQWIPGTNIVKTTRKVLRSISRSSPVITVTRGKETKLTLGALPKSQWADEQTIAVKATLKDEKGKPVANQTVTFDLNVGTHLSNWGYGTHIKTTATTNSSGVAQVTSKVTQEPKGDTELDGFTVRAYFGGKAKKYCPSVSGTTPVAQPKPKTAFTVAPTWDGHTGQKEFSTRLTILEGKDKGKPLPGVGINWVFNDVGVTGGTPIINRTTATDANGFARTSVDWKPNSASWKDYDLQTHTAQAGSSVFESPYQPATAKYTLKKQQGIKRYTVDMNQITVGSTLGGAAADNWFDAPATYRDVLTLKSGTTGLILGEDGKAMSGDVEGTQNLKGAIFGVSIVALAGGTGASFGSGADVGFRFERFTSNAVRVNVPTGERAATQLRVTLTLPDFTSSGNPEYIYKPASPTAVRTYSETTP